MLSILLLLKAKHPLYPAGNFETSLGTRKRAFIEVEDGEKIEKEKERSKMERSESEPIFDSLNLNPQLFINAAVNIVDELIQSAFDHLHQSVSILISRYSLFTM